MNLEPNSRVNYSEHVIWNYIIKHLLSIHTQDAFKAAAKIIQQKEGIFNCFISMKKIFF